MNVSNQEENDDEDDDGDENEGGEPGDAKKVKYDSGIKLFCDLE